MNPFLLWYEKESFFLNCMYSVSIKVTIVESGFIRCTSRHRLTGSFTSLCLLPQKAITGINNNNSSTGIFLILCSPS